MSFAEFAAVYAKCRAMSASMLKDSDYRAMSEMSSVTGIAAYLTENSSYGEVLSNVDISRLNRSALEKLLYEGLFNIHYSLYSFTDGVLREFLGALMRKYELEIILRVTAALGSGADRNELIESLPSLKHTELNLGKVYTASTVEELCEALRGSFFYRPFKAATENSSFSYELLEVLLYNRYYEEIYQKFALGNDESAASIKKIIEMIAELINLACIMRMKLFFGMPAERIYPYLLTFPGRQINNRNIALCSLDSDEFMDYLRSTKYNKFLPVDARVSTSDYLEHFLCDYCKKLYLGTKPSIEQPFAFLTLKEIEIKNLVHVIEGVRYNIDSEEIFNYLKLS